LQDIFISKAYRQRVLVVSSSFFSREQTNEKASLDGKRCPHIEATRTQKKTGDENRSNLEED